MSIATWWHEGRPIVPRSWTERPNFEPTWLGHIVFGYHRRTRWLRVYYWAYIWKPPIRYRRNGQYRTWGSLNRWEVRWCRLRGHPGEIYYNPGGMEPDHRCERCLEEIG